MIGVRIGWGVLVEHWLIFVVLFLILAAEFVNGWTDAPNAIATVISTRTLSPRAAVCLATVLNTVGAFFGIKVASTIGKGIINPEAVDLITVGGAMLSIIFWSILAWHYSLPTSESHALVAGLSGAGLATAGTSVLLWEGWSKVFAGLFFSTVLGVSGGWFFAKLIQFFFSESPVGASKRAFSRLQTLSASFMAFSHGSNDGQKFIGAFSLALLLGGVTKNFSVPFWVIILCAITMGIGTSVGGMRIIRTMGFKVVQLKTHQGFSAEASAASTIALASYLGVPVSTTHTINTSIVGVGLAKRFNSVHWAVFLRIVLAWLLTFPVCGGLSFVFTKLLLFFLRG